MIAEIKKALKLIRYGYGLKLNLIGGFIIWLLGIFLLCIPLDGMVVAGVLYIALGPLMLVQIAYTLLYSNIVAASPRKQLLELKIPDYVNVVAGVISYILVVALTGVRSKIAPERAADNCEMLIFIGMSIALIMLYYGAAYKYYWISSALFLIILIVIFASGTICVLAFDFHLNMVSASLICLVIIALGVVLSGIIRRRLYKKTLSSMACGTTLRKALQ